MVRKGSYQTYDIRINLLRNPRLNSRTRKPCFIPLSIVLRIGYFPLISNLVIIILTFFPQTKSFKAFPDLRMGLFDFINLLFLPFGISTEPYIFTKVLRPLIRYWRLQVIRIVVYLDDGLGVCPTFPHCYSQSMVVKSDLSQAGFCS